MATTKFKGEPVSLAGEFVKVGAKAPDFKLVKTDLSTLTLGDFKGKRVILNIFPSLDTKVCAMSVRQFNARAASLPDTVIIAVSRDLPFAHERFCTTNGINNVVPASDFRNYGFAEDYGVAMKDGAARRSARTGSSGNRQRRQGSIHRTRTGDNAGTRLRQGDRIAQSTLKAEGQ